MSIPRAAFDNEGHHALTEWLNAMERLTFLLSKAIEAPPEELPECAAKVEQAEAEVDRLGRKLDRFRV